MSAVVATPLPSCKRDGCEAVTKAAHRRFCSRRCVSLWWRAETAPARRAAAAERAAALPACGRDGCESRVRKKERRYCSRLCAMLQRAVDTAPARGTAAAAARAALPLCARDGCEARVNAAVHSTCSRRCGALVRWAAAEPARARIKTAALERLADGATLAEAAAAVGVVPLTLKNWQRADSAFGTEVERLSTEAAAL